MFKNKNGRFVVFFQDTDKIYLSNWKMADSVDKVMDDFNNQSEKVFKVGVSLNKRTNDIVKFVNEIKMVAKPEKGTFTCHGVERQFPDHHHTFLRDPKVCDVCGEDAPKPWEDSLRAERSVDKPSKCNICLADTFMFCCKKTPICAKCDNDKTGCICKSAQVFGALSEADVKAMEESDKVLTVVINKPEKVDGQQPKSQVVAYMEQIGQFPKVHVGDCDKLIGEELKDMIEPDNSVRRIVSKTIHEIKNNDVYYEKKYNAAFELLERTEFDKNGQSTTIKIDLMKHTSYHEGCICDSCLEMKRLNRAIEAPPGVISFDPPPMKPFFTAINDGVKQLTRLPLATFPAEKFEEVTEGVIMNNKAIDSEDSDDDMPSLEEAHEFKEGCDCTSCWMKKMQRQNQKELEEAHDEAVKRSGGHVCKHFCDRCHLSNLACLCYRNKRKAVDMEYQKSAQDYLNDLESVESDPTAIKLYIAGSLNKNYSKYDIRRNLNEWVMFFPVFLDFWLGSGEREATKTAEYLIMNGKRPGFMYTDPKGGEPALTDAVGIFAAEGCGVTRLGTSTTTEVGILTASHELNSTKGYIFATYDPKMKDLDKVLDYVKVNWDHMDWDHLIEGDKESEKVVQGKLLLQKGTGSKMDFYQPNRPATLTYDPKKTYIFRCAFDKPVKVTHTSSKMYVNGKGDNVSSGGLPIAADILGEDFHINPKQFPVGDCRRPLRSKDGMNIYEFGVIPDVQDIDNDTFEMVDTTEEEKKEGWGDKKAFVSRVDKPRQVIKKSSDTKVWPVKVVTSKVYGEIIDLVDPEHIKDWVDMLTNHHRRGDQVIVDISLPEKIEGDFKYLMSNFLIGYLSFAVGCHVFVQWNRDNLEQMEWDKMHILPNSTVYQHYETLAQVISEHDDMLILLGKQRLNQQYVTSLEVRLDEHIRLHGSRARLAKYGGALKISAYPKMQYCGVCRLHAAQCTCVKKPKVAPEREYLKPFCLNHDGSYTNYIQDVKMLCQELSFRGRYYNLFCGRCYNCTKANKKRTKCRHEVADKKPCYDCNPKLSIFDFAAPVTVLKADL